MAIAIPQPGEDISAELFGKPVAEQVNANTDALAANTPTPWANATLINGWANYGSGFANAQYRKQGDVVTIRGTVRSGTVPSTIFVLPTGFRPTGTLQFSVPSNGAHGYLTISTGGNVNAAAGNSASFELSISFPVS